jgi:hypothetical protein
MGVVHTHTGESFLLPVSIITRPLIPDGTTKETVLFLLTVSGILNHLFDYLSCQATILEQKVLS